MTPFEKWTVWGATIVMTLTGLALGAIEYLVTPADEWAVVNHPLQPWVLKAHILAAPVLVFGIGLMAARHILPRLRAASPRSGAAAAFVAVPMVLTGYLLQTLTHEGALALLGYLHLAAGTLFALASAAHARRKRASRVGTRSSEAAGTPSVAAAHPIRKRKVS